MSLQTISRRYAIALADVALSRGEVVVVQEELTTWDSMVSSNALLKEVFANPTIPYDQKKRLLDELISRTKVHSTTANFLNVLLKNQRLTELSEVAKRFREVIDERSGVVAASVITARPLPEDIRQSLSQRLSALTGKRVRLDFSHDEELIGGLVTRIGSTVYDGSIKNQLEQIERSLAGA